VREALNERRVRIVADERERPGAIGHVAPGQLRRRVFAVARVLIGDALTVWGVKTRAAPIGRLFARGRPTGASDPALAKMPSPATVGDVVATAGGPAQPGFVNVVIPEGSATRCSGRDERAGHGLDRVCAPHSLIEF
jgi:hypothetical protein